MNKGNKTHIRLTCQNMIKEFIQLLSALHPLWCEQIIYGLYGAQNCIFDGQIRSANILIDRASTLLFTPNQKFRAIDEEVTTGMITKSLTRILGDIRAILKEIE